MKPFKLVLTALCCCLLVYCLVCQRYSTAEAQANIATRQLNQCGDRMSSMSDVAMCDPDKFAWQLFVKITKPLPVPTPSPDSVPVTWEAWATDDETLPGDPSPAKPPQWPGDQPRPKRLRPIAQQVVLNSTTPTTGAKSSPVQFDIGSPAGGEEVQRNHPAFDYIVNNKLYYIEGLNDAFNRGFMVNFPKDAIEVKPVWIPFTDTKGNKVPLMNPVTNQPYLSKGKPVYPDPSRYHTNTATVADNTGKTYKIQFGLVAIHMMSKDTPNWTWQTFEQVDNPGRCDFIGCHDDFGAEQEVVAPNVKDGQYTSYAVQYPAGKMSPELVKLFAAAGIMPEWNYYRLKGSQNNFTDTTGQPQIVGSSITEAGFLQTSSCMTCHGRASIAPGSVNSTTAPSAASLLISDPTGQAIPNRCKKAVANTQLNAHTLSVFNNNVLIAGNQQSFYGPLPAGWYYESPLNPLSTKPTALKRIYMQTDFVWAFFKACPAGP